MTPLLYFGWLMAVTSAQLTHPTEKINSGRVLGKRINLSDKHVDAFLGIPYAESTEGDRRFKLPVPKAPWGDDIWFNATEYGHACWQVLDTAFPGFEGTEMWNPLVPLSDDCLNLNIWVPYPRPKTSAVLVWIFGGSFRYGASSLSLYDGKFLAAEEGLIVVSLNYRVGAYGFLATADSSAPGNQGLYDQAMALQWVQDNIEVFGGDPDQVTIFGENAGGASVAFHMLSPISQPLFQRAAIQSAGPTSHWAYTNQEEGVKRAKRLAESFGCLKDENDNELVIPEMVSCLQKIDANDLLEGSWVSSGFLNYPFVPVYDGVFLPEDPSDALENGNFKNCELVIGSNTNEANFFLIYEVPGFNKDKDNLLDYDRYIEALNYSFPNVNSFGLEAIAYQYKPWMTPNDQALLRDAVDLAVGDYAFTCPSAEFAMTYAKANNRVYYYRFEERASNSAFSMWMGVLHGDEIAYIFGIPLDPSSGYSSREEKLSRKLMNFWANFAKTGNPNVENGEIWPQYKTENQEYLVLDEALVDGPGRTGRGVKPLQCALWKNYLPALVTQTADIKDVEKQWKEEFDKWNNDYMVNWKVEFQKYKAK